MKIRVYALGMGPLVLGGCLASEPAESSAVAQAAALEARHALVRFSLQRAQQRCGSDLEICSLLAEGERAVAEGRLPVAASEDGRFNAGIQSYRTGPSTPTLVLGAALAMDLLEDPEIAQGILLHELQHSSDIQRLGWSDDRVRISRTHESRAHEIQARFYLLAPFEVTDPTHRARVTKMLAAYPSAPEGDPWSLYLDEHQGRDHALLTRLERLLYEERTDPVTPYTDHLLVVARDLLAAPARLSTDPAAFRALQSYLSVAIEINEAIMAAFPNPGSEAIAAQREWASLHERLAAESDRIAGDPVLLQRVGVVEREAPRLSRRGRATLRDFERWCLTNGLDPGLAALLEEPVSPDSSTRPCTGDEIAAYTKPTRAFPALSDPSYTAFHYEGHHYFSFPRPGRGAATFRIPDAAFVVGFFNVPGEAAPNRVRVLLASGRTIPFVSKPMTEGELRTKPDFQNPLALESYFDNSPLRGHEPVDAATFRRGFERSAHVDEMALYFERGCEVPVP